MKTPNLLLLNGSLRGESGNTASVVQHVIGHARPRAHVAELVLANLQQDMSAVEKALRDADAFLFCSGVYWNSHGSPMQRFLEVVTPWEATEVFMGKAAGVVLSMDSVGGMEVAARLGGVLSLFGCILPPLSTVVLSRMAHVAAQYTAQQDIYGLQDVSLLVDNLILAAQSPTIHWQSWPVTPTLPTTGQYAAPGILPVDRAPWLKPNN